MNKKAYGFTIVELLVVIVVIAILAAASIVSYTGIQERAQKSKVQSDIAQILRAITLAREQESKPLFRLSGSGGTSQACVMKANDTDLAALPSTDACWINYDSFLDTISNKSGVNIRGLKDPWNRPYLIDENEGETLAQACTKDTIAMFRNPFITGWGYHDWTPRQNVPLSRYGGCMS